LACGKAVIRWQQKWIGRSCAIADRMMKACFLPPVAARGWSTPVLPFSI
jgi:hypothetical protein